MVKQLASSPLSQQMSVRGTGSGLSSLISEMGELYYLPAAARESKPANAPEDLVGMQGAPRRGRLHRVSLQSHFRRVLLTISLLR